MSLKIKYEEIPARSDTNSLTGLVTIDQTISAGQSLASLNWKNYCRVATESALPSYTKYITSTSTFLQANNPGALPNIDDVVINQYDPVFVSSLGAADNRDLGKYIATDLGSSSTPWILTRSTDANVYSLGNFSTGLTFLITEGATYTGHTYALQTQDVDIDVTPLTFIQISGGSSSGVVPGIGISITGSPANTVNVTGNLANLYTLSNFEFSANTLSSNSGNIILSPSGSSVSIPTASLEVNNLSLLGNTLASTNGNGNIDLVPNGSGIVNIPSSNLQVNNLFLSGNTITSLISNSNINLTPNGSGVVNVNNLSLSNNTLASTNTNGNILLSPNGTGYVGINNISLSGNTISSLNTNENINISPNGTGSLVLGNLCLNGSNNSILATNTNGNILINSNGSGYVKINDLSISANTISSLNTNENIFITPNGTGSLLTGNLSLNTNTLSSTNTNGNILLTPNGTGYVGVNNLSLSGNTLASLNGNGNILLTPNGTGYVGINNISISGSTIASISSNSNISLSPNGTGSLLTGNLSLNTNTLASTNTNGNILLIPNGTGYVGIDNLSFYGNTIIPTNTNGNLILSSNGTGYVGINNLSFYGNTILSSNGTGYVGINNLSLSGSTIASISNNSNINISPNGTGSLLTGNLSLNTNTLSATNTNGNILLTPNGIGYVGVNNLSLSGNTLASLNSNGNILLTPNGTGYVGIDNLSLFDNTISSVNTNGNINLSPNGTGVVNVGNLNFSGNLISSVTGNINLIPNGSSSVNILNNPLYVGNMSIISNTITTTNTNGNLILSANGTGTINMLNNSVNIGDINISSNVLSSIGTNDNIVLIPNGTGQIIVPQNPTQPTSAASKYYVDALINGLVPKAAVTAKTATTIASYIATGAQTTKQLDFGTITTLPIDSINLVVGNTFLLDDLGTSVGADRGIYIITQVGDGVSVHLLAARRSDANTSADVVSGMSMYVEEGTMYGTTAWILVTQGVIVLDVTSLSFSQNTGKFVLTTTTDFTINGTQLGLSNTGVSANTYTVPINLAVSSVGRITSVQNSTILSDLLTANLDFSANTIISNNTNGNILLTPNGTGYVGINNLSLSGNTLSAINTNGNITLTPNGMGSVITGNISLTGSSNTISAINTNGNLILSSNGTGYVGINNLSLSGSTIASISSNSNINISPNGTGSLLTGNLSLNTNTLSATNTNGNILITPNGTGYVGVNNLSLSGNTLASINSNGNILFTPNGTGYVGVNNLSISGSTISSISSNSNITISPNGTGSLVTGNLSLSGSTNTLSATNTNGNLILSSNGTGYIGVNNLSISGSTISSISSNSNITISPNGTGSVLTGNLSLNTNTISSTNTNGNILLTPNGTGTVNINNLSLSGNTLASTNTNGNINLTPNGTGLVNIPATTQVNNLSIQDGNTGNYVTLGVQSGLIPYTPLLPSAAPASANVAWVWNGSNYVWSTVTSSGGYSDLPVGAMYMYPSITPPTGSLVCDGSAVSRTTYATLFAIIGITHGQGDGSTTFNLPDMRGRFVRGVSGSSGNDPDASSRTALYTGGNIGNNVGSYQLDMYTSHTHGVSDPSHVHDLAGSGGSSGYQAGGGINNTIAGTTYPAYTGISINNSGGNESRPKNIYEYYMIKVTQNVSGGPPTGNIPEVACSQTVASGTNGGMATSGSQQLRMLNSKDVDSASIATLSNGQITLPAGTYQFEAVQSFYRVDTFTSILYNYTSSSNLYIGISGFSGYTGGTTLGTSTSYISGRFVLGSQSTIGLQYQVQTGGNTNTELGKDAGFTVNNVYATITLWKVDSQISFTNSDLVVTGATISTLNTNENLVLAPNGTGQVHVPTPTTDTSAAINLAFLNALFPIGSIMTFATASVGSNCLPCNGAAVSRTTYSQLFSAIGITHGHGDGSTTFNVPDYRGYALRGVDGGVGRDPDTTSRTAMNTGGNTGDNVGSVQQDQYISHNHGVNDPQHSHNVIVTASGSTDGTSSAMGTSIAGVWSGITQPSSTGISIQNSGGNETRMKNAYVVYAIRAF